MTNDIPILERIEESLATMLAKAELPEPDTIAAPAPAAMPQLDEILAPAAQRLVESERQVQAADALLEETVRSLAAWHDRLAELRARLEESPPRAVS